MNCKKHILEVRLPVAFLLLGLIALLLGTPAFSQGTRASMVGTVTDTTGAVIPGALITIKQLSTNTAKTVRSSTAGAYTLANLAPGDYIVTIEKIGFNKFVQPKITLEIDQTAQIDAKLDVGTGQEVVTVSATTPLVQLNTSSVGLVIDQRTIQDLPLNSHTSLIGLIGLVPGVQNAGTEDQIPVYGITPAIGTGSRNSYGGLGFSLDGVQLKSISLQRALAGTLSLDAIAEFKAITSGAPAEFTQAAQIITASQSGGNVLHGELFEFFRGKGTSAKEYFAGALSRPAYGRNEFGGNISGPIILPKLYNGSNRSFFFVAYEGFHLTQATLTRTQQPTEAMRTGNFSEFLPSTIHDPYTGLAFPGNIIPQNRLSHVTSTLQDWFFPHPTAEGTGINTTENVSFTSTVNRYSVRIDHKINDQDQFRATYLAALYGPNPAVGTDSLVGGMAGIGEQDNMTILGYTHVFTPSLLWDTYASFTHLKTFRTPQNYFRDVAAVIPGLPLQLVKGAPYINITNITAFSEAGSKDLEQDIQLFSNVTKVFSRHNVKTGASLIYSNHWNEQAISPGRGRFNFNGHYSGNAYADFLLGYPNSTQDAAPGSLAYRTNEFEIGVYAQDDYRVTDRLTLNFGLRYDLQLFPDNIYGSQASFVPSIGKVVVFAKTMPAGIPVGNLGLTVLSSTVGLGNSLSKYLGTDANNIAPRFGFAYQFARNYVIRGAAGIYYNLIPGLYGQSTAYTNFPFTAIQTFSQAPTGPPTFTMANPLSATAAYSANPSAVAMHSIVTPYSEQFNLTLEHQFNRGMDVRISYVGQNFLKQNNASGNGNTAPNINLANLPVVGVNSQTTNHYQPFASINLWMDPIFRTNMNALQIGVHNRSVHGLQLNAEYEWTRVLGTESLQDPSGANPNDSYGQIGGIAPQVLALSYSYQLPFGRGQTFAHNVNTPIDKLIGGWRLTGKSLVQDGLGFGVNFSAAGSPVGLVSGRADIVPGVPLYPKTKTHANWFNPAAFSVPKTYAVNGVTYARYGNSGYNMLRGPGYQNWDMALMKDATFHERYRLELRASAFNVFNHPNFGTPNNNISNPSTIGVISGSSGIPTAFSRKMEFAAKFFF